jgi:hypothetical protein
MAEIVFSGATEEAPLWAVTITVSVLAQPPIDKASSAAAITDFK